MEYCGNLPHGNSKSERRHHRLMEYEYNFAWFITFDPDCTKNRNIKTSVGIFYRKQIVFEWFLFRVFSLTRQIVVKNSYELHQFSIFSIYGEWSQYYKIHAQQANDTKIRLTWLSWEISSTWRDKNREFHGNSKAPSISFDAFHALARLIVVVVDVVVVFFSHPGRNRTGEIPSHTLNVMWTNDFGHLRNRVSLFKNAYKNERNKHKHIETYIFSKHNSEMHLSEWQFQYALQHACMCVCVCVCLYDVPHS